MFGIGLLVASDCFPFRLFPSLGIILDACRYGIDVKSLLRSVFFAVRFRGLLQHGFAQYSDMLIFFPLAYLSFVVASLSLPVPHVRCMCAYTCSGRSTKENHPHYTTS